MIGIIIGIVLVSNAAGSSKTGSESNTTSESNYIQQKVMVTVPKTRYYPKILPYFLSGDEIELYAGKCVVYVQNYTGLNLRGNAKDWIKYINSDVPLLNSIIIMDIGYWGHIGIVINYTKDKVLMRSRNWSELWKVEDVWLDRSNPRILGYRNY